MDESENYIEKFNIFELAKYKSYNLLQIALENLDLYNFDINSQNQNDDTLLHILAEKDAFLQCKSVLELGADPNLQNKQGETPLHHAFSAGNLNLIRLLMKNGSTFNKTDLHGETPLYSALRNNHLNIIKLFYAKIPSQILLHSNHMGLTLLDVAILEHNLVKVNFLIKLGVFTITPNSMMIAVKSKVPCDLLQLLISKACVDFRQIVNFRSKNLLHLALENTNKLNSVKMLIHAYCDINGKDYNLETPLHYAVRTNQMGMVILLLNNGARVDTKDADGYTALHVAANDGRVGLLCTLLEHKADPWKRTQNGDLALHRAASNGHFECTETLLERMGEENREIVNFGGMTAADLAQSNLYMNVVQLLRNRVGKATNKLEFKKRCRKRVSFYNVF